MAKEDNFYEEHLHNLLNAPCVFCGYDGEGYYQPRTHKSPCPWYDVGGYTARELAMPSALRTLYNAVVEDAET